MKKITSLLFFWWISFALAGQEYQDYYIRGVENMNQKKYNEAIEEFTSCIEKNLDFEKAYLNRGICLQLLSDTKNEIKDFNKVIKLNSANDVAFYNRGLARKEEADYKKAIRDFTIALRLNPNLKYAYYNRVW